MTPDQWIAFAREWGLPLVMFIAFVWTHSGPKRRWVSREELDDKQAESDGWKALYLQERGDRIESQQLTLKRGEAAAEVAEAVASGFEKVLGRLPDPYDERLEGRRAR